MRLPILPILSALMLATALQPARGASPSPVPDVTYRVVAPLKSDSLLVRVKAVIPPGWHIQSNAPLDEFLIPTELKTSGAGVKFGKAVFPKPELKDFPALGGQVALFSDTLDIVVSVRAAQGKRDAKALEAALAKSSIALRYQACNDTQCLAPREVSAKRVR